MSWHTFGESANLKQISKQQEIDALRSVIASAKVNASERRAIELEISRVQGQIEHDRTETLKREEHNRTAEAKKAADERAKLAASAKKDKQQRFDIGFEALRGGIAKGEDGTMTIVERVAFNKTAIEATNAAFYQGLISQKQKTDELATLEKQRAGLQRQIADGIEQQNKSLNALKGQFAGERLQRLKDALARGESRSDGEKQGLESEVLRSKLDAIDEEYQAAIKAGRDQVLAAQQAKLEKERLYESEADKFTQEEERKTAVFREAAKARQGGSASPLVGLDSLTSGIAGFSGFDSFGKGFSESVYGKGTIDGLGRSSKFDDYQKSQLPGYLKDQFSRSPSYTAAQQPAVKAGDSYTIHLSAGTISPRVNDLVTEAAREAALEARRRKMTSGDGAPDSIKSRY